MALQSTKASNAGAELMISEQRGEYMMVEKNRNRQEGKRRVMRRADRAQKRLKSGGKRFEKLKRGIL